MALQNGKKIALAQRRHRVIQAKIAGRSEAEIAEQEGVAQYTIWKDIRAYLGEVRREDKEAVQAEYDLQRARYERYYSAGGTMLSVRTATTRRGQLA